MPNDPKKLHTPARSKKRVTILVVGFVFSLVLVAGTAEGLYTSGVFSAHYGMSNASLQEVKVDLGNPAFYEYEEMVVDLATEKCRSPYLRFKMTLQLNERDLVHLNTFEVKLKDRIQNQIRSYTRRDLQGIKGANLIRTDLVNVINQVISPAQIHAVMFNQFLLN